jgi:hypothetical protein
MTFAWQRHLNLRNPLKINKQHLLLPQNLEAFCPGAFRAARKATACSPCLRCQGSLQHVKERALRAKEEE